MAKKRTPKIVAPPEPAGPQIGAVWEGGSRYVRNRYGQWEKGVPRFSGPGMHPWRAEQLLKLGQGFRVIGELLTCPDEEIDGEITLTSYHDNGPGPVEEIAEMQDENGTTTESDPTE